MDKGHYVGMILLDSHNAFDTVNHIILLMKLRAISWRIQQSDGFRLI